MSNNKNEKKQPMYISVTEPQKYEVLASTSVETTQRLAKRISNLFKATFVDFHGCAIYFTPGNGNVSPAQQFSVELHFRPVDVESIAVDDERLRAFKPIEEGTSKSDIVAGIKNIYGTLKSSARFQLTKEGAEILSEFIMPGVNIDPFNPSSYDHIKAEYQDVQQYSQNPIMVKIMAVDLTKLIRKIYGTKNKDGKKVEYGIMPHSPVVPGFGNTMMQNNANWRVIIMQIEVGKAYDLAIEMGIIPSSNGSNAPIVTAD